MYLYCHVIRQYIYQLICIPIFFFFQDFLYFKVYRVLVSSANLGEVRSLGLNGLSGEGVDLVPDWGLNTG